jgi:hypothetical protein
MILSFRLPVSHAKGCMPAIVAIPNLVEEPVMQFGDLFPNQPSRRHFASSLTGLILAEHKTVSAITGMSSALITASPWIGSEPRQTSWLFVTFGEVVLGAVRHQAQLQKQSPDYDVSGPRVWIMFEKMPL